MAEVKVPTEAQVVVAPLGVHPPMEEVHLQKPFEAEQTEAGAFLTGGPTGEETNEPGGTNIKTFRQMANNNQRYIYLRYSKSPAL